MVAVYGATTGRGFMFNVLARKMTNMKSISAGLVVLSVVLLSTAVTARGDDYEPGTPSTYLFDTGTLSPGPLSPAQVTAKSGWKVVPEDTLAHKFQGDLVLLNDRLTVVLRGKGSAAEVYSQTAAGPKQRAVLAPLGPAGSAAASLSAVQILENTTASVMIEASFKTADGGKCSLKYRLSAGQISVETRPGEGAGKLLVLAPSRYVVVPDFFADDMVFDAAATSRPRLALPTENFFVNLLDEGNAMVMCVWQSNKQNAEAVITGEGRQRTIAGCVIQCAKDKNIWVAFLEGARVWHERRISAEEAKADVVLDWKPPFAAKWRGDLVGEDGAATSWFFQQKAGESEEAVPVAASGVCPCRLDADRALVQLQTPGVVAPPLPPSPRPLVVYALDRSRKTPITTFCPIDVLKNTLGVGPCQYILQTEGMSAEDDPTPDSVMGRIEKEFSRKKQKKAAGEIRDMLKAMTAHIEQAQGRIAVYADLAGDVQKACKAESPNAGAPAAAESLRRIADRMQQTVAAASGTPKISDRAAKLAGEVSGLISKDGALADCQRLGAELRGLGAIQDRTLAKCRMDARWLRQQAAMMASGDAADAALAKTVQARTEQILGVAAK